VIGLAGTQAEDAVCAFTARDATPARHLETHDDSIDRVNRQGWEASLDLNTVSDERELANARPRSQKSSNRPRRTRWA
jgi:hypothetical protein